MWHYRLQVGLIILEVEDEGGGSNVNGLSLKLLEGLKLWDATCPDSWGNPLLLGDMLTPRGWRRSRGGWIDMPDPLLDRSPCRPLFLHRGFDCL